LIFPIALTFKTCCVTVLLHSFAGVPLAFWCARSRSFASRVASFFITLPLVFPPIALGYMLLVVLGRTGVVGGFLESSFGWKVIFSETAVYLSAFVAGLPLVVRPISAAFENENLIALEQAARVTGSTPLRAFFFVTLPMVKVSVISGLLLGTARAFGEVGVTMMLGGNISHKTNTLSLEVFNRVSQGEFDSATKLCALLAVMGFAVYVALEKLKGGREF
jgi:molybdate transport system permease protein